ncbi:hypothetical protein HAHE_36460 [Haloferula helveola]|uniref:Uncharacterized protein n=1 Tax=Haloferula helveola TaxID=490095 RepID=A0ABM7RJL2_9BACT|nr:hypothetical protein HAHE_36460 [Haloferula helveola]
MSDPLNRRRFGRNIFATGVGTLLAGAGFHATARFVLATQERRTLHSLTGLFPQVIIEDVTEGKGRTVRAAASIDDFDAFLDPSRRQAALPDTEIRADGDALYFRHSGTDYIVRLLLPRDFARLHGTPLQIA